MEPNDKPRWESLSRPRLNGRAEGRVAKNKLLLFYCELDKSGKKIISSVVRVVRHPGGRVIRPNKCYLMLINLKHDGLQDEGGGGDRVQRLLRLS